MGMDVAIAEAPTRREMRSAGTPRLVRVARRGPLLRPSPTCPGIYGLDLTAGCFHGCAYCHIRGSSRHPGEDRVLFDPFAAERIDETLDGMNELPRQVVLSPNSDPLPPLRDVRRVTEEVVAKLLSRGVPTTILTRGRFSPRLISTLAEHPEHARALVGISTLDAELSRRLEPRAASPRGRIRDIARLIAAGVGVEVRVEPLIPDRTDTRENLAPLFAALGRAGARDVVAHALFLHSSMTESLDAAISPLGWSERLRDQFAGGPSFRVGSLGIAKHLPADVRREALARWISWGSEHGLIVRTGAAQNPDLPVAHPKVSVREYVKKPRTRNLS